MPDFWAETKDIRAGEWKGRPTPPILQDRRVEITGPVSRKMVINALNSGANAFMADFEDSSTPTWANMVEGQVNLLDAVAGTINYTNAPKGKKYELAAHPAVSLVRPRGLHLDEKHLQLEGQPMSAGFFDFALFVAHCAKPQEDKGAGPCLHLPALQH